MTFWILGIWIIFVCYGTGRFFINPLKLELRKSEEAFFSIGAGLGITGYAVLGLGIIGFLRPGALWALLLALTVFVLVTRSASVPVKLPWTFTGKGIASFLGLLFLFLPFIAGVMAPETANDSLCYHLHLPKIYLAHHTIRPLPYELNSEFPFLMEMLYTLGLGLSGAALAKFFHFFTALLTMAGIYILTKKLSGAKSKLLPLIFLTTPAVFNEAVTTYVDIGLAAFTLLALAAVLCWTQSEKKQTGFLVLAGIFTGLALSIKYLALISAGFFLIWIFCVSAAKCPRRLIKNIFTYGFFAAAACAFWYARSWIVTGNPVFPYFAKIFGAGDATIHYNDIGVTKTFLNWLTVFWTLTMRPELFEGFSVQIGPAYLAFLPLVFLGARKNLSTLLLAGFSVFYLTAWFLLGQSLRFLLPMLPALLLLAGLGWPALAGSFAGRALKGLACLILVFQIAMTFYHSRHYLKAGLGLEPEDLYLQRVERSFEMASYVNQQLPPDSRIIAADDPHLFYFDREIFRETAFARLENYWKADSEAGVFQNLRRKGITHILYVTNKNSIPGAEMPEFRLPRLMSRDQNELATFLKPLYTYTFTDEEGLQTRYYLYEILP